MTAKPVRVRFAPAPTGIMHLGNIRTALMNYLFARQKDGTFVLRIEDTDPQRNYDPQAQHIIADLQWLGLDYDEGPIKGGPYAPYFQSERTPLYAQSLEQLKEADLVYRCFCTSEELDKKRDRQKALKLPPRYDRTCMRLSTEEIARNLAQNIPFIWRFKLDHERTITITDLARGQISFDLKNFSDFPLTRADGSFTFLFANFVDDYLMRINYVFRGEDHLSNTANQAALYHAFDSELPIFWHMPILCNVEGRKLSKRDFGFSIHDLRDGGFLPEAICNYLIIIGGSHTEEFIAPENLINSYNFDSMHASGQIKYDVAKLRWLNHKWINFISLDELVERVQPFIKEYPKLSALSHDSLADILKIIRPEMYTLADAPKLLEFLGTDPKITEIDVQAIVSPDKSTQLHAVISAQLDKMHNPHDFFEELKNAAKAANVPLKDVFRFVRLALMGSTKGPSIPELLAMLDESDAYRRLSYGLKLLPGIK